MSIIIGSVPVHMDAHAPSYHVKKHNKTRCFEYTGDFPLQSLGPLGVIWETIWFILKSLGCHLGDLLCHLSNQGVIWAHPGITWEPIVFF